MTYARNTKAELIRELEARDLEAANAALRTGADKPTTGRAHPWDIVHAGSLSGDHIGTMIRVRTWNNNTEAVVITTAELRQVGHSGARVFAHIGVGAEQEITMDPEQPVTLRPPADYADVATLAMYDEHV